MRVTVCELDTRHPAGFEQDWRWLAEHVIEEKSELVLLPEMPFAPWFAAQPEFDPAVWDIVARAHTHWQSRLSELGGAAVLTSRPIDIDGRRANQAVAWEPGSGLTPRHEKYYLPDEERFWEASWYGRGSGEFAPFAVAGVKAGFQICTEMWFFEHARAYGQAGVHLVAVPRATERQTVRKWLTGARSTAIVSGAYCLSSNRVDKSGSPAGMGGLGWIIDPEGQVLAVTSSDKPFVTLDIQPETAEAAKRTYPRCVAA